MTTWTDYRRAKSGSTWHFHPDCPNWKKLETKGEWITEVEAPPKKQLCATCVKLASAK